MSHQIPFGVLTNKRGRKWTTISHPDNFRTHILNRYHINFQRVRGTSWFLIQWPQNEVAEARLSNYERDSLSSLRINLSPYDTIIYVGVEEKPHKGDVTEYLHNTIVTGRTFTSYSRNMLPLWWNNACSVLRKHGIIATTIEKAITTETQLLLKNGVLQPDIDNRYDPHSLNKDLIESYRLVSVDTSAIPPYVRVRHSIKVDDKTLIVFRDTSANATAHSVVTSTMRVFYANMRLIEWATLHTHNLFGAKEEAQFKMLLQAYNISNILNYATPQELLGEIKLNCLDATAWNDDRLKPPLYILQESLDDLQQITQNAQTGINEQNDNTFLTEEE